MKFETYRKTTRGALVFSIVALIITFVLGWLDTYFCWQFWVLLIIFGGSIIVLLWLIRNEWRIEP